MYAKRGLGVPERRIPAIPSIAWTLPARSRVKSTESCQRTDSPSRASLRACSSHGPTSGSSHANSGAVETAIDTM